MIAIFKLKLTDYCSKGRCQQITSVDFMCFFIKGHKMYLYKWNIFI